MVASDRPRLALLIDAENLAAPHWPKVVKSAHVLGYPIVRRVFADWTGTQAAGWKESAETLGLEMVQVTVHNRFKNAVDIGIAVAAIDLLAQPEIGAIALASSDSDFSALVHRIRAADRRVFGIGFANANAAYRATLTKFVAINAPPGPPVDGAALGRAFDAVWGSFGTVPKKVRIEVFEQKLCPGIMGRHGTGDIGELVARTPGYDLSEDGRHVRRRVTPACKSRSPEPSCARAERNP